MRENSATHSPHLPLEGVTPPPNAVKVGEWIDTDRPPAWRSITATRRGVDRYFVDRNSPSGPHFVEAHATQEADGSLTDVCIRAEIDAWDWGWQHECWDTMLTPEQARAKGAEMRANAEKMIRVADAFDAAAADAERWVAER